jgi:hypothetical protein
MKCKTSSLGVGKRIGVLGLGIVAAVSLGWSSHAQQPSFDWTPIGAALGKPGTVQPDGVYKISLPRSDLQVKVGDVQIKPALALGSWVAFRKMDAQTMVMGDLVLTENEVAPVMAKLQEGRHRNNRAA